MLAGRGRPGQRGCDDRERVPRPARRRRRARRCRHFARHRPRHRPRDPRGGLVVALPVAEALAASIDVVIPRKLGAPGTRLRDRRRRTGRACPARASGPAARRAGPTTSSRRPRARRRRSGGARRLPWRSVAGAGRRPTVGDRRRRGGDRRHRGRRRWARAAGADRVVFAAPVGPPAARRPSGARGRRRDPAARAARVPRRGGGTASSIRSPTPR